MGKKEKGKQEKRDKNIDKMESEKSRRAQQCKRIRKTERMCKDASGSTDVRTRR